MTKKDSALTFPCQFPIKVIGNNTIEFEAEVVTIIRKHIPDISEGAFQLKASKEGKYTSMTITITATSQEQLDNIYRELSASPHVIMSL